MKPHWFHILMALSDRDRHGSGIVREVARTTDAQVTLWPVTLYKALEELMAEGLVVELTEGAGRPQGASRRRRYFRLTPEGRQALAAEAERLLSLGQAARQKLAATPTASGG